MMLKTLAAAAALALMTFTPAEAQQSRTGVVDRSVRIENLSGVTIREFYATNTGRTDWGRDHLGAGTLPNLYSKIIQFSDGTGACRFDFRAVFTDGRSIVTQNVDICGTSVWTYR